MRNNSCGWMLVLCASLALAGLPQAMPSSAGQAAAQTSREHQLDLESFEYVWRTVYEKHFDPIWGGVDWKAVHAEFRPQAEAASRSLLSMVQTTPLPPPMFLTSAWKRGSSRRGFLSMANCYFVTQPQAISGFVRISRCAI